MPKLFSVSCCVSGYFIAFLIGFFTDNMIAPLLISFTSTFWLLYVLDYPKKNQ